jgi:hypothetical protein
MAPIIPNNPRKINVLLRGFRPFSGTLPAVTGGGNGFQVFIQNIGDGICNHYLYLLPWLAFPRKIT